jgi:hypothetical protein
MRGKALRLALGLGCILLLMVAGLIASGLGQIYCHQESDVDYGRICHAAANGYVAWLPVILPVVAVLLLVLAGASRKALGFSTAVLIELQIGVGVMWALVAHGTLR